MGGGGSLIPTDLNPFDNLAEGVNNSWERNKKFGGDLLAVGTGGTTALVGKKIVDKQISDGSRYVENKTNDANRKNEAIIQDMKNQELVSNETKKRDEARARQRMLAAAQGGRSGTLLTSPLGVTDSFSSGRKTLLGE